MKFSAVALVALCALAVPAVAAPVTVAVRGVPPGSYQVRQTTVTFGDLDLTTGAGAAALLGRLQSAAGSVCGNSVDSKVVRCRKWAVYDAVRTVDEPLLTEAAAK
jgi:UrcA family protein